MAEVTAGQLTADANPNVNQALVSPQEAKMNHFASSAIDKLRRFCYLGTAEAPVYATTTFDLTVECHFAVIRELCDEVSETDLVECLMSLLDPCNVPYLPRRDEALLVLAVYLSSHIDEKQRTVVRSHFVELVRTDKDLFLFVKFVKQVQKAMERKTPFSRTVRKAVLEWYQNQPLDKLLHMWSVNESAWSLHHDLLHRCHYGNAEFDAETRAAMRLLSTPVKELAKWPHYLEPVVQCKETIVGIANLRLLQKPLLAMPIIKQLSLSYEHVPRHIMTDRNVANFLLHTMSYEQLLHSWPTFLKLFKCNSSDQCSYIQRFFDPVELRAANLQPIRLLLQETRGANNTKIISKGAAPARQLSFIQKLYKQSFGCNKALGVRLQITLNLEMCYIGKYLNGRWRSIRYLDAVVAIAFGYFKCDPQVNVKFWHDKSGELKGLPWFPEMSVDEAKAICENQNVNKIKQTLTDVIDSAQQDTEQTYDVFLVLVPCASRGNPGNKSEQLCQRLDEYRQTRNMNAKFIIMSLRENHASMSYSKQRNEHILELCSITEETPRLISAFALGKFY